MTDDREPDLSQGYDYSEDFGIPEPNYPAGIHRHDTGDHVVYLESDGSKLRVLAYKRAPNPWRVIKDREIFFDIRVFGVQFLPIVKVKQEIIMEEIVYVAVPYSHEDESVREGRFRRVCEYVAELSRAGVTVFSPISMMHPVAKYGLPGDWAFWEKFDTAFLRRCDRMIVLCLDGWEDSTGVNAEIKIMQDMGKPIIYEKNWPQSHRGEI